MQQTIGRKIFIVMFALFIGANFLGCSKLLNEAIASVNRNISDDSEDSEADAIKLTKETTYYNDFLGVSYTIPKGWWLYDIREDNFSTDKSEIADSASMDLYYDEDDKTTTAYFISFGNLQDSTKQNHLGFDINAESLKGVSDTGEYMKYYEKYMLEPIEETTYTLEDTDTVTIKGKKFELRAYMVHRDEENYYILTLTTPIKNNYFLNILANYWPENENARKEIIDSVTKALSINN